MRRRLTAAFALLIVLLVTVGAGGIASLVAVDAAQERAQELETVIDANREALQAMTDAETATRGYRLAQDRRFLEPYWAGTSRFPHVIATARAGAPTADVLRAIDDQVAAAQVWQRIIGRPVAAMEPGNARLPHDRVEAGRRHFDALRAANARVGSLMETQRQQENARADRMQGVMLLALLLGLTAAGTVGTVAAVRTRQALVVPLGQLHATVSRLTTGDREARAPDAVGPVEVREVASAVNLLAAESARWHVERTERDRVAALAVEIGRTLRDSLDVEEVLREAVRAVGPTLDCDRAFVRLVEGERLGPVAVQWYADGLGPLGTHHVGGPAADRWHQELLDRRGSWVCDDVRSDAQLQSGALRLLAGTGARSAVTTVISSGGELLGTLSLVHVREPHRWADHEVQAVEAMAGDLARALAHAHVFDQQRRLVDQLRELDRTKTDFLSTVSHELRTPLTSIAGYVELLRDQDAGPVTPEMDHMLEVVERNAARLTSLIEDLLTLSRIESGAYKTMQGRVDVRDLLSAAMATVAPTAAAAGVHLELTTAEDDTCVLGDGQQLERVLLNLLSNAVKFTPAGGRVAVSVAAHEATHEVVMAVTDTGIGIPEAEQARLFTRFFRATNATQHAIQGTGLGLAIVRSIVDHHGGTLALRSREGRGTTVTLRLPLAAAPPAPGLPAPESPGTADPLVALA